MWYSRGHEFNSHSRLKIIRLQPNNEWLLGYSLIITLFDMLVGNRIKLPARGDCCTILGLTESFICTCGRVVKGNGLQNRTTVGSNPTPVSILDYFFVFILNEKT